MVMVRDIKIKSKRTNTEPRLGYVLNPPALRSARGLTNPPDHCMLECGCIYNGLVRYVCCELGGNRLVVFSTALHVDRHFTKSIF